MGSLWNDKVNPFLMKRLYASLFGVTAGDWLRLLRENRFAVDAPYLHRATLITANSFANSILRRREDRRFGPALAGVKVEAPIFVLGHWRSGTTHLHNLLAQDPRFAYPNLYQVFYPHTFMGTEDGRRRLWSFLLPKNRLIDNVAMSFRMPFEDEYATCTASFRSPYMSWVFPRGRDHYDRFLTFREVPAEDLAAWKAAFVRFLKKLTLKHGRPLVLKSPPHTCRIRLLLDLFPDARFVHIHRDPYRVFQSTQRTTEFAVLSMQLQRVAPEELEPWVLARYRVMYDAFFEERGLIPDGQFHELSFEALDRDPLGEMREMYGKFGLPGFEAIEPRLERYLGSLRGYRKNHFPEIAPTLRRRIAGAWGRAFEEWAYRT